MWNKKSVSKSEVESLQKKFALDALTASIFVRRGITKGKDILYFMEDDLRFQHNPFLFSSMENAVDRILDALPENGGESHPGEKILIFGDKDVDGITATTVLYEELLSLGADVQFKVPQGDDAYGLSLEAVDEFAQQDGTLIITVDCGIANNREIAHAASLGIDVIVLDHHNPQEELPSPALLLDPKIPGSGYPFEELSGCAVAYKTVSALRFSKSRWYKAEAVLLNARAEESQIAIECIKTRNLVPVSRLIEYVVPGEKTVMETRIPRYLEGQAIFCWDKEAVSQLLAQAFGSGTQFNMIDMRQEAAKLYPSLKSMPLSKIKFLSKIAKYGDHEPTEIGGFYNIFVTYVQQSLKKEFPSDEEKEKKDLQLVALAALADVMPMKNENRLFVRKALQSLSSGDVRPGLKELMSLLNLLGKRITSGDICWTIVPNLNAAGRLGQAKIAVDLFTLKDAAEREQAAKKITELNSERKRLTQEAVSFASEQARQSVADFSGNLCFVLDERINRGVSGILAGQLVTKLGVPAMAMTCAGNIVIGSMRSCRGYDVTSFLEQLKDLFISHGGHAFAAGFSFEKEKLGIFRERVRELSKTIELESKTEDIQVDAEIPASFMTPELQAVIDRFEPYGNENQKLTFLSRSLPVIAGTTVGKTERQHLKITVDCGKNKWPCLFWNTGEMLHRDFEVGDKVNILFNVERNSFNGTESLQLLLCGLEKCGT